ncbi:MAG: NYN domain-containing protein [Candidatus Marinimicrobia bacterium]|nr:NYN domain-containing protein [Candidatus Neomarinimicrobiota bacterium]
MRKIIIDGYNLIYSMPGLMKFRKRKFQMAREGLLRKIAQVGKKRKTFMVVVFDGKEDEIIPDEEGINEWVQVRYSPHYKKADTIIVELAQAERNPRSCTVVTSDKAIIREVLHAGMKTISSEDFAQILDPKLRPHPEMQEEQKPEMNPADMEAWRSVFGRK